mgnify:FL=1
MNKKQARKNLRETRENISKQISELRRSRNLTIEYMSYETGIPSKYLEKLENQLLEINLSTLSQIARFFDKKIKIELVD